MWGGNGDWALTMPATSERAKAVQRILLFITGILRCVCKHAAESANGRNPRRQTVPPASNVVRVCLEKHALRQEGPQAIALKNLQPSRLACETIALFVKVSLVGQLRWLDYRFG
jgi:hypothetical protein